MDRGLNEDLYERDIKYIEKPTNLEGFDEITEVETDAISDLE